MQGAATSSSIRTGQATAASDWFLLAVPGLIWGASFLFIAEALRSTGPNGVAFGRILVGFVTLSLFPAARRPVDRRAWPGIAALGILWLAFPLTMFPFAEQRVSSALTGMLNGANPLFTAIVAAFILRRLPSKGILSGFAIGMCGAVLLALPAVGEGSSSTAGVLMILAALVSYAFALNMARPLQQRYGALPVIWRAQMVALILTAPLGLPELSSAHWSLGPVLALLALGALGTGLAHAVMAVAAGRMGATRASGTTFLIPAVALVLGILVRHEKVALLSLLGSAACIGGAWFMRRERTSEEQRTERVPVGPGIVRRSRSTLTSVEMPALARRPVFCWQNGEETVNSTKTLALVASATLCLAMAARPAWPQTDTASGNHHQPHPDRARMVTAQELPALDGAHLNAILVEVTYGPGESSPPHSHPCAVIGYIVDGAVRTQVKGQPERTYRKGESFYEAPNGVHLVSANASSTRPAKFVAYLLCDHDVPISVDVPDAAASKNVDQKGAAK